VHLGAAGLANVIQLSATLTSQDTSYANFDAVLIAYLQRDFTATYQVDPVQGMPSTAPATGATLAPTERCTADGAYCLGIYFPSAAMPRAYYYLLTRGPDAANGLFGEDTTQVTIPANSIGSGSQLSYRTYLIVGNKQRVATTIKSLHDQLG
jgi:hypothetical protein